MRDAGAGEAPGERGRGSRLLDSNERKLHVKPVGKVVMSAVAALSSSDKTRAAWEHERRWLEDEQAYIAEGLVARTADGCPQHNMREGDVALMEEVGVIERVGRKEVRSHVQMFLHDEPAKGRYRPIRNCAEFNGVTTRDVCSKAEMARKADIVQLAAGGGRDTAEERWMLMLDFAAYYDQIGLVSAAVRNLFCFRDGNKYYRLTTLPMGIRIAVGVAGALTALLLDFGPQSVVRSIIDNVVFVGTREQVLRDAAIFVERCNCVGLTLNEDTSDLEALLQQRGVWGGVHIDLVTGTTKLADKTLVRTQFSWENRSRWTWRQFAAHVGLLWWAVGIVEVPMHEFFPLLRFVSHVSRMLTEEDERWEQQAQIWSSVWPTLERWTEVLLRNEPRVVPAARGEPQWIMATDACSYGWGVVATNTVDGRSWFYGARWFADFARRNRDKMHRSTFTECHAIVAAACKLLAREQQPAVVQVLTDSTTAVATYRRGFNSRSYDLNECAARLKMLLPRHDFFFAHIAGVSNPADWWSRNPGAVASEERRAEALRSLRR